MNQYWEKNLPSNYSKPGPNSRPEDVKRILTEKYVDQKWIDTKLKHDPVYLLENKPKKFEKWLNKKLGKSDAEPDSDQDAPPQTSQPAQQQQE